MSAQIVNIHRDLIEKCKSGNRTAQYELYSNYADAMFNICMRMLSNREDAEDVLQDSFINAFSSIESFRYDSTFGAWVKRIVINKCINFLKSKRIKFSDLNIFEFKIASIEDVEEDFTSEIDKVKWGISQLPNGYKQIINLYLIEGYDHIEIGEILGISNSTSKSQYHRAKKKLVQLLKLT